VLEACLLRRNKAIAPYIAASFAAIRATHWMTSHFANPQGGLP
jgi:hypothetical protein